MKRFREETKRTDTPDKKSVDLSEREPKCYLGSSHISSEVSN